MSKVIQLGLQLRDDGIERVAAHNQDWLTEMRNLARHHCAHYGSVTTDWLQHAAWVRSFYPDHPNAWGAVFKEKGWICIGRKRSTRPSAHAREIKVWRWQP